MVILNNIQEDLMPTFMMSLNWTDQGIRAVKDSPKRSEDARELAKKVGVEIKHLYLTSGDTDLVIFVDAPSGDNVAKFALAVSSLGNVRTRTVRAWSADNIGSSFPSYLKRLRDSRVTSLALRSHAHHSLTSSARASTGAGRSSPNAFAVVSLRYFDPE